MEDPPKEISDIVHRLTQGSPKVQEDTINEYFTQNANFTHPFCRTGSFNQSRILIHAIFRWYKVMSPKIDLKINSIAYDSTNLILYVNISQVFSIWFIPFHHSPVTLTTQLHLEPSPSDPSRLLIRTQNDLYQVDQFVRFVAPWGIGVTLVYLWHFWATFFCVVLAWLTTPFTLLMQKVDERKEGDAAMAKRTGRVQKKDGVVNGTG